MPIKNLLLFLFFHLALSDDTQFTYNGFRRANLTFGGITKITSGGLLQLTNDTRIQKGSAFYPDPFHFKNTSKSNATLSFSTTFVFAIVPINPNFKGHGIAFVVSKSKDLADAFPTQYIGLFNQRNNGESTNHVFAIELDTGHNKEFGDIDDNHVGIDVNSLISKKAAPAAYFSNGRFINFSLSSGDPIQIWIDFNGEDKQLNVTLSPTKIPKPDRPLLSTTLDLDPVLLDSMYVGFSSATGELIESHYILGWSFKLNGQAPPLVLSALPSVPRVGRKEISKVLTIGLPLISFFTISTILFVTLVIVRRRIKFAEVLEDWEQEFGPERFRYKDLFKATRGFRDKELLGIGGFGRVYKGVLQSSKTEVAIKRVSHDSKQGMKEFVAEIVSLGRLRHRNLVQLLGYCRRKGELLLVYDYMPNGSLDKFLFGEKYTLSWTQRFQIIKGVASGLLYLHQEWEQIVLHRDVKASNILLDGELNGRLGDFGLARLYDHGNDPRTTHVVGTLGYIAPEMTKTRKATTSSDVFSFGAFMLEVGTGRRPIDPCASGEEMILVDWVSECWKRGSILEATDPKLGFNYQAEEMELVLKLGLLCSHPVAKSRPCMRQVVQYLDGGEHGSFPDELCWNGFTSGEAFQGVVMSSVSSSGFGFGQSHSVTESVLSGGR